MRATNQDEKNKNKGADFYKTSKFDVILIGFILFFSVSRIGWFANNRMRQSQESRRVLIYRQDLLITQAPLEKDKTIILLDGRMQVDIQAGRVRVTNVDCPQHLCMNMGWIQYSGQTIVCVPNQVLVEIKSKGDSVVDAVTF